MNVVLHSNSTDPMNPGFQTRPFAPPSLRSQRRIHSVDDSRIPFTVYSDLDPRLPCQQHLHPYRPDSKQPWILATREKEIVQFEDELMIHPTIVMFVCLLDDRSDRWYVVTHKAAWLAPNFLTYFAWSAMRLRWAWVFWKFLLRLSNLAARWA